jgi:ubiquitin-like domain-containing CTD phosphatase 1
MNEPRENKPLLVLDLDHTLLDFSSKTLQRDVESRGSSRSAAEAMKRPHMDSFLTMAYLHYDLVVWSQTSWRWLETKLIELGMVSNPGYKFCFVLDKTSMFAITSTKRDGSSYKHQVKPLQLIWSKYPRWGSHNTCHLDDLSRNFALNLKSGLKVSAYYRKKSKGRRDAELLGLQGYLERLAQSGLSFDKVDFTFWMDVASGKKPLEAEDEPEVKK